MPIGGFEKLQHISDNLGSHIHMKDCSHVLGRYEKSLISHLCLNLRSCVNKKLRLRHIFKLPARALKMCPLNIQKSRQQKMVEFWLKEFNEQFFSNY